jgi:hypothetical protein
MTEPAEPLSKTVEALEKERNELREKYGEAVNLLTVATAAAVAQKSDTLPAPAPKPEPLPAPALPPPPRPASSLEYYRLPSDERRRVAEAYGGAEKLEAELDAQFHNANRIRNARSGVVADDRRLTGQIGEDREAKPAPFDSSQYYAGAPRPFFTPATRAMIPAEAAVAEAARLNAAVGAGARRPPAASAPTKPLSFGDIATAPKGKARRIER